MNKEELNMDKSIREKLDTYAPEPPQQVWDNILTQLSHQKKNVRILLYRRLAAAAVVLIVLIGGWHLLNGPKNNVSQLTQAENGKLSHSGHQETIVNADEIVAGETTELSNPQDVKLDKGIMIKETDPGQIVTGMTAKNIQFASVQYERIHMSRIKGLPANWEKIPQEKFGLRKGSLTAELSESERMLIAENARLAKNNANTDRNWVVGIQVAPGYSSQITDYGQSYSSQMTYSGSEGNGTIGGGFSVQVRTGKKLHLESGVYYARNGQKSVNSMDFASAKYQEYYYGEKDYFNTPVAVALTNSRDSRMTMNSVAGIIEFAGTPEGTELVARIDQAERNETILLTSGEFSQVFDLLEIPIYLRYSIVDSGFGLDLLGGINAGVVAGNNVFMKNSYGVQNVGKTRDISSVNFSGTLGVGFSWEVSPHLSLSMEPRISYYLNSINTNPEIEFRPYRIGLFTGLYYEF